MKDKICFKLSSWRIIIAAVGIIAAIAVDVALPEEMLKFTIAVSALFAVGGLLDVRLSFKAADIIWLFVGVVAAFASVVFIQLVNECSPLLPLKKLLLGTEASFVIILIFCNIFVWLFRNGGRAMKAGIIAGVVLLLGLGVINFYTAYSRGKGISPVDFRAIGTALSVAGNYTYAITARMWQAILLFVAAIFFMTGIKTNSQAKRWQRSVVLLLLTAVLVLHLNTAISSVRPGHWANSGCENNGLILNLSVQLKQELTSEPESYDRAAISAMEERYAAEAAVPESELPNVIVIMNEAFSDMRVWGEFETNIPVMPYIDSLTENTIKGRVLTSVLGGTTPNSEYEFITGNSLFFHSPSSVPYQQFIYSDTYCLERYLGTLGYSSYFTHPALASNWSRNTVYPLLGFDEITFDKAYEEIKGMEVYAQDDYLFEKLIEKYESGSQDKQFIYAVTVQNHSPYGAGEHAEPVMLENGGTEEINEYLSRIHESDAAFKELTEYFAAQNEPVIIMMYGDHQPKITSEFKKAIGAESKSDYKVDMTQYIVPFVIWANYDIEEQNVEFTSLNFLSNYLLEAAGIPLSPYNSFLKDVNKVIPAMNAYGYWSNAKGGFASYEEAEGEERQWLEAYENLQYNAMFDKKGRSEVFFPLD